MLLDIIINIKIELSLHEVKIHDVRNLNCKTALLTSANYDDHIPTPSISPSRTPIQADNNSPNVMSPRQLLRKPYPSLPRLGYFPRRFQSSPRLPPHKSSDTKTQARAAKVLDRVPRFLRRYTDGLRTAPVTHVVSFLILHELTAVIPLVGLASYFHYANWLPPVGPPLALLRLEYG